jgi:hypothetical protein
VLSTEERDALRREGLCDEDPHAGTVAALDALSPAASSDSAAAA